MFRYPRLQYRALLVCIFLSSHVLADPDDYIYPFKEHSFSNYGTLGLIQNPNARFLDEGSLGFSWSHNDPYLRGSLIAYPFSWLEVSYQYTDINNRLYSPFKSFSGNQSFKDKSFDTKIRLIKESQLLPQVAVGLRDLAGTGLFSSEFIVASKHLSKGLDLTMGIGWGTLTGQLIKNPLLEISDRFATRSSVTGLGGEFNVDDYFSGPAGYFFGFEYHVPKFRGMKIKFEYDGTNYKTENSITLSQSNNLNFGIVFPQSKSLSYKFNFTRGNTVNFGFSYKLNLGKKNAQTTSKEKQSQIRNSNAIKIVTSRSDENLYKGSLKYLSDEKIFLQHASINDNELEVIFAQTKYRNPVIASGRALNILDQIAPNNITSFKVSEINGGVGLYSIGVNRNTFIRDRKLFLPPKPDTDITVEPFLLNNNKNYKFNPEAKYPALFHTIGPDIRSQIGGPDGFFFGDVKIKSRSELLINRGLSIVSEISYGLYDNMDDLKLASDSVLPHVRTDIVKYLKQSRNLSIQRMQLNKFGQISPSIFYKFSAGILEYMFNGYGSEALFKPFDKNYAIGIEAWKVYQRNYDQMFGMRDYQTTTGHLSFYYHEPITNIIFKMKGGKFLAQDSGISFELTREFYSGLRLSAFITRTDISKEEFGEGSFDKGFSFYIPLEIFSNSYNSRNFGWGLRPITRDGGATLSHGHNLWGVAHKSNKHKFNRHLADFYD
ncbi:YjbH domain-containing protein [Gammaproteobacteria bacterium]|nr:YjbH domain-containing protein [Gammaproteobacteria bacterium]MDC0090051.1 YjbH domain-containing protein [Gammaproteobacteria bacterium]